jgi:hypothetical protein
VAACYSNSNERRQRKIANSHVGGVSVWGEGGGVNDSV